MPLFLHKHTFFIKKLDSVIKIVYRTTYSSIEHTLNVKKQIEKKRNDALLGGGKEKIDTQHKKVHLEKLQL